MFIHFVFVLIYFRSISIAIAKGLVFLQPSMFLLNANNVLLVPIDFVLVSIDFLFVFIAIAVLALDGGMQQSFK